jgi:hypothetical protein
VASLDWLWLQVCGSLQRVDGIKIDVQGMEREVLQGMTSVLARWKPKLAVEVHPGMDRRALLDVIEAAGYGRRGTPIEPVEGETEACYVDDHSYAFQPNGQAAR